MAAEPEDAYTACMSKGGLPLKERRVLLALAAVNFTHIVDFMILMPLGQQLIRIFSITPMQFSLLVSSYSISAGISGFLGTFWLDRFDRKRSLLIIYFCFTLGTFACALAPSYALLMIARIATGAFGGMIGTLVNTIVGDSIPAERRGRAMGVVMSSFSVASVLGVPLGLFIATQLNWHAPFFALGGLSLLIIPMAMAVIPAMRGHLHTNKLSRNPREILLDLWLDRNQQRALLFTLLLMLGHFSIVPFISPSMVANVGFTEAQLTYIYFFGGFLTIFTSPLIGRFSDRYGRAQVFTVMVLFSLIPILLITHMKPMPIALAVAITSLFFIAAGGRFIPAMATLTAIVPTEKRGSFLSLNTCVQNLASGIGSYVAGMIVITGADGRFLNYPLVGYFAVGASLLCILQMRRLVATS